MANTFTTRLRAFRVRTAAFLSGTKYPENMNADLCCDPDGNLWVRDVGLPPPAPPPSGAGSQWTYQAVPGDDNAIIQTVPSILTQVGGFNDSAASMYVQLFDRATVPVAGNTPIMTFLVPSLASFGWTPSRDGRRFATGIAFAVSSTRDTYTVLATPIFLFAEGFVP